MNRLKKMEECGAGQSPSRVAYVLKPESLPPALDGKNWREVDSFNAADDVLNDPSLKEVFKEAIAKGCAVVSRNTRSAEGES